MKLSKKFANSSNEITSDVGKEKAAYEVFKADEEIVSKS